MAVRTNIRDTIINSSHSTVQGASCNSTDKLAPIFYHSSNNGYVFLSNNRNWSFISSLKKSFIGKD
jgi:hypothetical protein